MNSHALAFWAREGAAAGFDSDQLEAERSPPPNSLLHLPSPSYTMWNNPPGNWPRSSQLEFLITRATTAAQPENNYALHIEIAEYINKKKANTYIPFS